jgi:tRNA nucleotidyltransferase (CCA-adding enzyme)
MTSLNVFLVGGAVRDQLLNIKSHDNDYLVVGATSKQMLELGFIPVGKDFPVFLHPKTKEEYALARTERKSGHGYKGFTCYAEPDVTIEQDLMRRDLTINAIARSTTGEFIDPYNGMKDIENRVLRHVSPAFSEDPLRVLRVARFAARYADLGFTIAPETLELMATIVQQGELSNLTAERIWQEFAKTLAEDHPDVFFQTLRQCGALAVIWPELNALWGVPNPAQWHPEICSGIHTMMVLQQAVKFSPKISVRFAALCHDLGKSLTPESLWPRHQGHEKSGLPLVEDICQKLRVPNDIKWLSLKVCEFHLHCHKAMELKASTLISLFNSLDLWRKPTQYQDFLLACKADFYGRKDFAQCPYPQYDYLQATAKAASAVNAQPFVQQGLSGMAIKNAIHHQRITAVEKIKQTYIPSQT